MAKSGDGGGRALRRKAEGTHAPDGVQSVHRALSLLQLLSEDEHGYRLSDLAVRAALAVPTTHRLLTTLEERDFVRHDRGGGTWHVGPRAFAVGAAFPRRRNLVAAAMPLLRALRDRTRETVTMGMPSGGQVMVVAQVAAPGTVLSAAAAQGAAIGSEALLTANALGRALLSTFPADELAEVIGRHGFARAGETQPPICRAGQLEAALDQVRAVGYAAEPGDLARCIASPVLDGDGRALAAIGLSGAAGPLTAERLEALGGSARDAAAELSRALRGAHDRPA